MIKGIMCFMRIKNKEMEAENITQDSKATRFWASVGLKVKEGFKMHQKSGQLAKGPDSWRNVTKHCLVQVARTETLGRWLGLSGTLIDEMKLGAFLHDFDKKQEMIAIRQVNRTGASPLAAARAEYQKGEDLLRNAGFSSSVRRLASSAGGDAPQLIETQRILDKEGLSDEDMAYLIAHYVDDCSIGSDWVKPSKAEEDGNIIEYRAKGNKANPIHERISQEITAELSRYPEFGGMNNVDAASLVSHQIEQRLAQRIKERTGEDIDPLTIPELVDQKIREAIEKYPETS